MNNGGSRILFFSFGSHNTIICLLLLRLSFAGLTGQAKEKTDKHQECMPSARPHKLHKIVTLIDISFRSNASCFLNRYSSVAISTPAPTCTTGNGPTKVPAPGRLD